MALFYLCMTTLAFLSKWCYSVRKEIVCYPRQPQMSKKTEFCIFFHFLKPICSNMAILWCRGIQPFCIWQVKVIKHGSLHAIHSHSFCKEKRSRMIQAVWSRRTEGEQHISFCLSPLTQTNKSSDAFAGKCARGGREWCWGSWVLVILMMHQAWNI